MKNIDKIAITVIIFLAALSRIIPHPPNFTPIMAVGLLSGAFLKNNKFVFIIPICAMLLSDGILEYFYGYGIHATLPFVYCGILICTYLGTKLSSSSKFPKMMIYTFGASFLFFIVTNFGVWLYGYPKTISGLISCYTLAIPFYRNALAGDLFYTGTIFGLYLLYKQLVSFIEPNVVK